MLRAWWACAAILYQPGPFPFLENQNRIAISWSCHAQLCHPPLMTAGIGISHPSYQAKHTQPDRGIQAIVEGNARAKWHPSFYRGLSPQLCDGGSLSICPATIYVISPVGWCAAMPCHRRNKGQTGRKLLAGWLHGALLALRHCWPAAG
jgi:hypothetical protein